MNSFETSCQGSDALRRRSVLLLIVAALACGGRGAANGGGTGPPPPTSGDVAVWMTTGDKTKLLQRQSDLRFGSATNAAEGTIVVDTATEYQDIVGFGAAFTGASTWLIQNKLTAGQREALLTEFRGVIPAVHAEKGCIEYGAAVDAENALGFQTKVGPDTFLVVEKWESMDALKAHAAAPHMAAYAARTKDMVASRVIHVLSPA
jgi:quinol monooxygenase YgiN